MIQFKILKKSKKSNARLGHLKTPHGIVRTPSLVPVATQAVIKTLTADEVLKTKTQIWISNTFHLYLKPGDKIVKSAGGLHEFSRWPRPIMTDSGGFQVFSLGFGMDSGVGKMLKYFPGKEGQETLNTLSKPKDLKITDDGVYFKSPINGSLIFFDPKKSIRIQENLGADIIFAFDECTSPLAGYEYAQKSLERTHKWAEICGRVKKSEQALFGIVQGSHFKDLREASAKFINSLGFDGFGIGGDLGKDKKDMLNILRWTISYLNDSKPRHLLGVGHLEDIEPIIKEGIDLFDCTVPTHYARRGAAFTSQGKMNLGRALFLNDKKPLDKKCACYVCETYTRSYISHLVRAKEITGLELLTFHNLFFFNSFVENIRERIRKGEI